MKKMLFVAFLSLIVIIGYSQINHSCEIEDNTDATPNMETILKYIPDEFTTIKHVKVNFHFMMKSDSTLNFRPFDDGLGNCSFTAYDYSNQIVSYVNQRLSGNEQMHLPPGNATQVLERKYRIILKDVYFHYDDDAYTYDDSSQGYLSASEINFYSVHPESEINVFFVYDDNPNGYQGGGNANMSGNRRVRIKASWQKYRDGGGNDGFWGDSWTLIHEIGHNLGLNHTMHYSHGECCDHCDDGCSDTPTRHEIIEMGEPDPCPHWGNEGSNYSNNAMDYSGLVAITPQQLGIVHHTLTHDMLLYLEDNYCSINSGVPEHRIANQQSLTWQNNRIMMNNLIIEGGCSLTIKDCWIHIPSNACIIVEPDGELIIENAIITNKCGMMWPGIQVWGDSNAHQYAVSGSYGQGYLELKNGATIENAECALALWRPGYWGTTGGIVHAEDAVFRNNHRAIHALHYRNHSPVSGKETGYNATFTRCQFTVDGNYPGDGDHVFHKHVDLDHVRGFKFRACDFSVAAPSENISQWTSGIAGYEAGFSVSGLCENSNVHPCPSYDNSTFSGFFTAVSAVNIGAKTPPAITVMRSSFAKNDYGIYTSNLSNATVAFCDFDVKRQSNRLCGAGIFCENMFNHSIEENLFAKSNTFSGEGYGVVIKDCAVQSRVYRNGFENLHCGNLAWGRNMLMKSSDNYIGLEYGCNTNAGNAIDFYVLREDGVLSGIQSSQGSGLSAARNTFSADGYHFYNGGDYKVGYYYYDTTGHEAEEPQSYNSDKLVPIPTGQTDGCPSNYSNGPVSVVLTPAEKRQREQDYYEAYTSYNSLKAVYDSHVDGGSTAGMLGDIASAASSDMWTLREQLLGASPYLSSDVLQAASDRDDVFTESVLFEILLSNPDELKKDSLMDYLRNRETPLPQYMMDILEQVSNGTTAKTVMQNRMAALRHSYSRAAGDIVRSLVNDTVLDITELRGWLGNLDDIHADRDIISTYVDEGDFADALALAAMLPGLYNLTGKDLAEHDGYVELIELYRDLYHDGRNTMQLDSTERALVENIAEQGTGYPQAMAQAVLHGTDWESYTENPFDCPALSLPEGGRGMARGQVYTQEDLGRALGMGISLKPNPAATWATVDYTLPAKLSKATISVTNALGITVMTDELNGNQGQKVIDLRGLDDGVYIFKVHCRDFLQTGKLVITK